MHIHDNIGFYDEDRVQNRQASLEKRLPFGLGDLHLAAGWGNIPFSRYFGIIGDSYRGIYMMEHSVGAEPVFIQETIDYIVSCMKG